MRNKIYIRFFSLFIPSCIVSLASAHVPKWIQEAFTRGIQIFDRHLSKEEDLDELFLRRCIPDDVFYGRSDKGKGFDIGKILRWKSMERDKLLTLKAELEKQNQFFKKSEEFPVNQFFNQLIAEKNWFDKALCELGDFESIVKEKILTEKDSESKTSYEEIKTIECIIKGFQCYIQLSEKNQDAQRKKPDQGANLPQFFKKSFESVENLKKMIQGSDPKEKYID